MKDNFPLNIQFAELYALTGKTDLMVDEYLDLLNLQEDYLESVENVLSKLVDFSEENSLEYDVLKQKLLEKVQKDPEKEVFSEMLIWLFIQKKNFKSALIQSQAFDKRTKGDGRVVYDLGVICIENKEYEVGRNAFTYIKQYGQENAYYFLAEAAILNSRFIEVTQNRNYSTAEIFTTIQEYNTALSKENRKKSSIPLILELGIVMSICA